ncbi:hypothetical protein EVAR_19301_1 [Eumeta japonica]|uniref:Uncharacterized protein n=1 Tax=Eumeta variegata TaxID=151549 RepID=A0A4C1UDA1_EUMVA|nr:hypothetical protein EVAR_19301_1 [Eumeta japonica]
MGYLKVWMVAFCIIVCSAELLGPDTKSTENKESDKQDDSDSEVNDNDQIDAEYFKDIKKVVNLQIQLQELKDYMSAVREAKKATLKAQKELSGMKDDSESEDTATDFLEELKGMKKIIEEIKPGWLENIIEMPKNKIEVIEENPQEILDTLPPLPEETEPALTPDEEEAKVMYDTAMTELSRRPPDLDDAILLIKEAAEKGYASARVKLAWSYLFGEGVEMDFDKAKTILKELAEVGNADAHAVLMFAK